MDDRNSLVDPDFEEEEIAVSAIFKDSVSDTEVQFWSLFLECATVTQYGKMSTSLFEQDSIVYLN